MKFTPATQTFQSYPSPTRVTVLRDFSFTKDGKVCSSQSNLPAYAIEGGVPSYLCIDPAGGERDRAALAAAQPIAKTAAPADSRPAAVVNEHPIAVLPFVDMSADTDQEYFADGMAEELLNLLTQVPQLRVTSRASAFSFKGQNLGVPDIARRLNVAHVLEGSVRMSGTRARVTAQLIDARSDTQLWSQSWDRELGDIFAVQDEIAAAVVTQLKVKLLGEAPKARPVDPKAYALFLQARQLSNRMAYEGYPQAEVLYRQALAIDPDDASAYALAGWLDIFQSNDLVRAARELGRAVALEPTSAVVLDKAVELRDPLVEQVVFKPYFDGIRSDPRWLPFLRRIGRAPDQLATIKFDVKVPN